VPRNACRERAGAEAPAAALRHHEGPTYCQGYSQTPDPAGAEASWSNEHVRPGMHACVVNVSGGKSQNPSMGMSCGMQSDRAPPMPQSGTMASH
jgi:hypothetical protein